MATPSEVEHGLGFFPHRGLTLVEGEGCMVHDAHGRTYLDAGGASYGTMNVGHAHPRVVSTLREHAGSLTHASQVFANDARSRFVDDLLAFAGPWAERVFLSNSGTEAIECALKVACAATGRDGMVALEGGFHGRTLGALAATHKHAYRAPFTPRLGATTFVGHDDAAALFDAIDTDTALVLVEPIQGEGGVRPVPDPVMRAARERCDETGALLVFDEVQTGLGRTGHDLATHASPVEPDIVCLAKSLAAGLPLGATLVRDGIGPFETGLHGSTFGGSPLVCRVASTVLDILAEERLAERAARSGERLVEAIDGLGHPLVRGVRGAGLMIGVELACRATPVLQAMQGAGTLALPAGDNVVRLLPPLVLNEDDGAAMVATLHGALDTVQARFARAVSP